MKNFARRIAVVIGALAVSAGLVGATAIPAHANEQDSSAGNTALFSSRDSSWPA
jgi:hypothetical protein